MTEALVSFNPYQKSTCVEGYNPSTQVPERST